MRAVGNSQIPLISLNIWLFLLSMIFRFSFSDCLFGIPFWGLRCWDSFLGVLFWDCCFGITVLGFLFLDSCLGVLFWDYLLGIHFLGFICWDSFLGFLCWDCFFWDFNMGWFVLGFMLWVFCLHHNNNNNNKKQCVCIRTKHSVDSHYVAPCGINQ